MTIRVVIAEEHTLVRLGTRAILEQDGDIVVVAEAADGDEAVEAVRQTNPHAALVDFSISAGNGLEATRHIKMLRPTTAVLVLTAYDDEPYVRSILEAGAAGYLTTNIRGEQLLASVRAAYGGEAILSVATARFVLGQFESTGNGAIPLSEKHHALLLLTAKGLSNREIAMLLSLCEEALRTELRRIFAELGVASRTEAIVLGLRQGWLRLADLA